MATIANIMDVALGHFQAGRFIEAESICQQILQIKPNHPDALHLLGLIADQAGKHEKAAGFISRALEIAPNFLEAHINLAAVLQEQSKLTEAVESCLRALRIKPDFAEAHNNLGNALQKQGKLAEAAWSLREAIRIKPDYAEAHNNLGVALQKLGKLAEAVEFYQKAVSLKPGYVTACNNLGDAFHKLGKLAEAAESFNQALGVKPDYAEAHNNLGNVLKDQGKLELAAASYRRALSIKPDYAEAHNNLGNVLKDQGKLEEAAASYRHALSIKPDYAVAYSNLLFLHCYHASPDSHQYLSMARDWEVACVPAPDRIAARGRKFQRLPLSGRRLKVGYVSGDFRQHAVSYFVEQLFMQHDRARIELFAYSTNDQRDAVTERLKTMVDHWVAVAGMTDAAMRDRIEADGIDVLIDLSGHTAHNRLGVFARRAAPVQAHYLGYFASTGLTEMDYWIGDEILAPAEMTVHFSEQIWRLPRVWLSYDGKDAPLPHWQPSQDGIVWLGSFNNLGKLTPATLVLWAEILLALPEAKLLLKNKELADAGNCNRILETMAVLGIASDRIELQHGSVWHDYMACHNRLDIALDPVGGHGGGTSTCDALWMGVPVIHCLGNHVGSRFAASMLNAIGHPEWIAQSEMEYVTKVVALARDVEYRKSLRLAQRDLMAQSPLCDAHGLAMDLENAYFEMFKRV